MPRSAPDTRATQRLLALLDAYVRGELWLRIRRYYRLGLQLDQVWVEVVDAQGVVLPDRFGRVHTHTLQVPAAWGQVAAGQVLHLRREGEGVWVERLPDLPGPLIAPREGMVLEQVGA